MARALALQGLYEADVTGHPVGASFEWCRAETDEWCRAETELPDSLAAYALGVMEGVVLRRAEIDESIQKVAPAWPVRQLAVVDRNILRLALYEILYASEVPRKVAINEAVELAKAFGSESSARFVNGVLGSVMDEMDGVPVGTPQPASAGADNNRQEGE